MLLNYKIKNFKTFKDEIDISFIADMHIKKLLSNTIDVNNQPLLKVVGVYGPNNTGKSCLIQALYALRLIMLNEQHIEFYNSFFDNHITEIEATYEVDKRIYRYTIKYDSKNKLFLYEKLEYLKLSKNNNLISEKIFLRDSSSIVIKMDKTKNFPTNLISHNLPLFMIFKFENTSLEQAQQDYIKFAKSIDMVDMNSNMSVKRSLYLIQNDEKAKSFITSFARNCDINIEDFGYSDNVVSDVDINNLISEYDKYDINSKEILKIWSKHHGSIVPSVLFDSIGTRKLISLAGYIYDSLIEGKLLLIDELDSSLHHIITRAIISLFNNELNNKSQLVFSTHDVLTMDLRRLFRKDQIYLTDIDKDGNNKLIHLSKNYTSRSDNSLRGNEDVADYYLKGRFGGIPTPDLFNTIYGVLNDE